MSESTRDGAMATGNGYEGAYIAHLWERPNLCVAFFGVQHHTEDGMHRYDAAGINQDYAESPVNPGSHDWRVMLADTWNSSGIR